MSELYLFTWLEYVGRKSQISVAKFAWTTFVDFAILFFLLVWYFNLGKFTHLVIEICQV